MESTGILALALGAVVMIALKMTGQGTGSPGGSGGSPGGSVASGDTMDILIPLLKQEEGFRPTPYSDPPQMSIGYGTKYIDGVTPNPISRDQAEAEMISQILEDYQPGVMGDLAAKGLSWDDFEPHQQAAILSFAYNLGARICSSASWPQKWKAGQVEAAKTSWLQHWNSEGRKNPVLVARRQREWNLFTTGRTS
jgi:GH24 family phage-related lysozyme (muramidase)